MGKNAARLGDLASCLKCLHGTTLCPSLPPTLGPGVQGSANVLINGRPALRKGDRGIHAVCAGPNTWNVIAGSRSVEINGKPAARKGDSTKHCGGNGKLKTGSQNVFIGD